MRSAVVTIMIVKAAMANDKQTLARRDSPQESSTCEFGKQGEHAGSCGLLGHVGQCTGTNLLGLQLNGRDAQPILPALEPTSYALPILLPGALPLPDPLRTLAAARCLPLSRDSLRPLPAPACTNSAGTKDLPATDPLPLPHALPPIRLRFAAAELMCLVPSICGYRCTPRH